MNRRGFTLVEIMIVSGVSVYRPSRTAAEMQAIDARIDDGNLNTGNFRHRTDGYIYIIEF
ncbi:MAG: prepilin-type N-terminal cleavage/methylation domain-containing protein [Kiritimatiellia bacterium]